MMEHAIPLEFSDDQMAAIKEMVFSFDEAVGTSTAIELMKVAYGGDCFDEATEENKVDSMGWAIPEQQWHEICSWITERSRQLDPYAMSAPLAFMNWGPSAYRSEELMGEVRG